MTDAAVAAGRINGDGATEYPAPVATHVVDDAADAVNDKVAVAEAVGNVRGGIVTAPGGVPATIVVPPPPATVTAVPATLSKTIRVIVLGKPNGPEVVRLM